MVDLRPPDLDEIEVSLFGPGIGESIAIHIGAGKWMVIDSCRNPQTDQVACLEYFARIGIDPTSAIRFILATHWHTDHIDGLAEVVERGGEATFALSDALRSEEFKTLLFVQQGDFRVSRGVSEFGKIVRILTSRRTPPIFAKAHTVLFRDAELDAELVSLSPTDEGVLRARYSLSTLIPKLGTPRQAISDPQPNHISVVVSVRIQQWSILLGADLEERADVGWSAILDDNRRCDHRHSLFKVPHHGSRTSQCERVWQEMLSATPDAALTPYTRGKSVPDQTEVAWLKDRTSRLYTTAEPKRKAARKWPSAVERSIREAGARIQRATNDLGRVTFRLKTSDGTKSWNVDLDGAARQL